jgi:hypothetical protein
MAGVANIDVEALEYFISRLQSFNNEMESKWGGVKSSWQAASDSWRDAKQTQFTDAVGWDEVIRMMEGYLSTSEQYVNFLKRLDERARAYLET